MHRNIYMILGLLIGGLLIQSHNLSAQNITAISGGNWFNPGIWDSGTVPTETDTAIIQAGITVYMSEEASSATVAQLLIMDTLTVFNLNASDLTVTGPTLVRKGSLIDENSEGKVQFKGHFRMDRTGIVDMRSSNTGKLIFENGITNVGDTMWIGGCRFEGNDQSLFGTRPVIASKDVEIADNITITNELKKALFLQGGKLNGQGDQASFINVQKVVIMGSEIPMETGQIDFSTPGNEAIYQGFGDQDILGTTYYELTIDRAPDKTATIKNLVGGDIHTTLYTQGSKTTLDLNGYNLIAEEEMDMVGFLVNSDTTGIIEVDHLIMAGGRINGSDEIFNPLTVRVKGNLTGERTSQFNNVNMEVADTLIVESRRILSVGGLSQVTFNYCRVDSAGDLFLKTTTGSNFEFNGKVLIEDGLMNLRSANYVFHDSVRIVGDSSYFQGRSYDATYTFHKPLEVSGRFGNTAGMFMFSDDIMGTYPLVISDSFFVAEGATVVNRNTGGLDIRGEFNGLSESSVFQNAGTLILSSEDHFEEPMEIGTWDLLTHPNNTLVFASSVKNQPIYSRKYYNLSLINATKELVGGDVEILGNLNLEVALRSEEVLDQHEFIFSGAQDQFISGTDMGEIQTIEIAKPSGAVHLENDLTVSGLLVMTNGLILTGEHLLSLSTSGQLEETRNSYVIGRVGVRRDIGAGQSRQFGGLGLSIRSSSDNALGQTIVVRTTGKAYEAGQMEKYYEITPTNNVNLNAKVDLIYNERDIVGAMEKDLYLVHQEPDAESFTFLDESGIDMEANVLTQEGIQSFGIMSAKSLKVPVKAYPSPLRDGEDVTIEVRLPFEQKTYLNVFDRAGRSIARYTFDGQAGKNSFKLENLQLGAGIFFVRVKSGRMNGYQTFIKITD